MNIKNDVSLKDFSTMRLGGNAKFLVEARSDEELVEAINWAKQRNLPPIIIGAGSNIVWQDSGFDGLLIVNKILGISSSKITDKEYIYTVGGGENWDKFVELTCHSGMSGIAYLSLIPGSCGAAPIQNIGAYGADIADTLEYVEAYDSLAKEFVKIHKAECGLEYRSSRFKTVDKNRFFITRISLKLTKSDPVGPYYQSVQDHFDKHNITKVNSMILRDAVIAIRTAKLPDPLVNPNNGSFFANPIINKPQFDQLIAKFPEIVFWKLHDSRVKLSAGKLMELAGYKDRYDPKTGIETWPKHTLTLVNKSAKTTQDLIDFRDEIVGAVKQKFGVVLEQEPELLP